MERSPELSSTPEEQEAAPARAELRSLGEKTLRAGLLGDVKFWSGSYNDAEAQFAKYAVKVAPPPDAESALQEQKYRQTLESYEADIAYNWQQLSKATEDAYGNQAIHSLYDLADAQKLGVVKPHRTIEAATGIFYEERAAALSERLQNAEQNEQTKSEQQVLQQTWQKVMNYIDAATDYELLHEDYHAYQAGRRSCHNEMIRQLNAINQLAEKYQVQRFTARDFMTNDFAYSQKRDSTGNLNHRANYDRETVLAYFQTVFQKDFEREKRRAEYGNRLFS